MHIKGCSPINVIYSDGKKETYIPLTGKYGKGKFAIIDYEDVSPLIKSTSWHLHWRGYVIGKIKSKSTNIAKLIINASTIDHINNVKLDNRKANLRSVTQGQNTLNRFKNKNGISSKYKGVCRDHNKWMAQIGFNRKKIWIGRFETEDEAALAYNKKAKELFGIYGKLNIIQNCCTSIP